MSALGEAILVDNFRSQLNRLGFEDLPEASLDSALLPPSIYYKAMVEVDTRLLIQSMPSEHSAIRHRASEMKGFDSHYT